MNVFRKSLSVPLTLIFLNVALGLAFESLGALKDWWWAESLVALVTFAHLFFYFYFRPSLNGIIFSRTAIVSCLFLSTAGELILSAVLGLYVYRESILPAFVPPGHVLLFIAGVAIAESTFYGRKLSFVIPALALLALGVRVVQGTDFLSVLLYGIFVLCLVFGPDKKLYAVMFALALGLEILGTALGSWSWNLLVPGTSISSANPPLAAGVFYAVLDLLVRYLEPWRERWKWFVPKSARIPSLQPVRWENRERESKNSSLSSL